jgi:hypothetical protein
LSAKAKVEVEGDARVDGRAPTLADGFALVGVNGL